MKFRKKPVVIEARQIDVDDYDDLCEILGWCSGRAIEHNDNLIAIDTLEGTMRAGHGDWIIRGVQGEFYPCKPDIFAATYEAAADLPVQGEPRPRSTRLGIDPAKSKVEPGNLNSEAR